MSRDLVLCTLVLTVCGWLIPLAGLAAPGSGGEGSGTDLERRTWRRLWAPLIPAAVMLATLVGWALQEPSRTDELLRPWALAFAAPVALLWLRAGWRAWRALRVSSDGHVAATIGLVRPRVIVDPAFCRSLDPACTRAMLAHEEAHVRHRDPARVWLAQMVTDVQWPSPPARRRLAEWCGALEFARDEEARRQGVRGEDLAAAILAAAQRSRRASAGAIAHLTGAEQALVRRIDRLLAPLLPASGARVPLAVVGLVALLAAATLIGVHWGDTVVRALPIVGG